MPQPNSDRQAADLAPAQQSLLAEAEARLQRAQAQEIECSRIYYIAKQAQDRVTENKNSDDVDRVVARQTFGRAMKELEASRANLTDCQGKLASLRERLRPLTVQLRHEESVIRSCHDRISSALRDQEIAEADLQSHLSQLRGLRLEWERLTGEVLPPVAALADPAGQEAA